MKILTILFFGLAIFTLVYSVSSAFYYCYLYTNLHRNMKEYMSIVDRQYVKVDVVLRNAVMEALEQSKEKNNKFEERAYTKLYDKIKGKW